MSPRFDTPTLQAIALHVDDLLMRPGQMATVRHLVENYLDGRAQNAAEAIPFPADPDELDHEGTDGDAIPTPAQRAAALAALRDAYCPGVEKVVSVPSELPEDAAPAELKRADLAGDLGPRARPGGHAGPWFALQLRRLEQALSPACGRTSFDDDTRTVTLDGARFEVEDPKGYAVYRAIVERPNAFATKAEIGRAVKGVAGQKTIPRLVRALPEALRRTVRPPPAVTAMCCPNSRGPDQKRTGRGPYVGPADARSIPVSGCPLSPKYTAHGDRRQHRPDRHLRRPARLRPPGGGRADPRPREAVGRVALYPQGPANSLLGGVAFGLAEVQRGGPPVDGAAPAGGVRGVRR